MDSTVPTTTAEAPTTAPATTTASTNAPQSGPTAADFKACEDRLANTLVDVVFGEVVNMKVGEQSPVVVYTSISGTPTTLPTIPNAPKTTVEQHRFTCETAAQLTGLNFDIDNPDWVRQSFRSVTTLTWRWNVIPRSTKATTLTVTFWPVIQTPDGFQHGDVVKTATLTIAVVPAPPESFWKRLGDFGSRLFWLGMKGPFEFVAIIAATWKRIVSWWRKRKTPQPAVGSSAPTAQPPRPAAPLTPVGGPGQPDPMD